MFQLLALLFGLVSGVAVTLFFLNFAFFKLEGALQRALRQREAAAMRYLESTDQSNTARASKVEAICRMARFDNNIMGPVIPVHAVLFGSNICVYQIDSSTTSEEFNRTVITAEHLIGKISTDTVISASEKLSKFHRHTETTMRHAPLRGNCLVLRCKPGLPLFLEDPIVQLSRFQEHQRQQQQQRKEKEKSGGRALNCGESSGSDCFNCGRDGAVPCRASGQNDKGNFGQWTAVLFKMQTRRELERWFNLLQATPQSEEWLGFIKRLPRADVFNLVVARLFFENTRTSELQNLLVGKLRRKLRKVSSKLPKHLHGEILLDRLELGGEIPLIGGASDPIVSPSGELQFDFDLLYRGGLKLGLRFAITYRGMRVPDIIFNVKVLELSNRMQLSVGPPPTGKMWLGSSRTPQLRLEFTQEVASNDGLLSAVLKLIPDMSAIMSNVVKVMLFEDMVLPSMDDFPLPCLSYSPSSSSTNSPLLDPNTAALSGGDDGTQLECGSAFSNADTQQGGPFSVTDEAQDFLDEADTDDRPTFTLSELSSIVLPGSPAMETTRHVRPAKLNGSVLSKLKSVWKSNRGKKQQLRSGEEVSGKAPMQ